MDQCEALAAAYGLPPRDVLRWPMLQVEEWWNSYVKRLRRELKLTMRTNGLGALGAVTGATPAAAPAAVKREGPQLGQVPDFVYSEWQGAGKQVTHQRAWYGEEEVHEGKRRPTDTDDWDVPPGEVFKLMQKFPGAVQMTKKT